MLKMCRTYSRVVKHSLLTTTAFCFIGGSLPSQAYAACVTTGAIVADCDLTSDTTGAITVGNGGGNVTITITNDITIGNTINDDNGTPDGALQTDGSGVTISQTAAIGGADEILTLTVDDADSWTASNDITTDSGITIGGGNSGVFFLDGSSSTVTISSSSGGIEVAAGGSLTISDTTSAVSVDTGNGIDLATGATLTIADDSNLTIGAIDGNAASQGTLVISAGHSTDAVIGGGAALAAISLTGGTFTVNNNVTADATTMSAGTEINVTAGTFASAITGSSGADTIDLDGGTISQDIDLGNGANIIEVAGGTLSGNLTFGTGNDTFTVTGTATISGDIAGGTGVDSFNIDATQTFSGDISGMESADVATGATLTLGGDVSDELNVVLNGTGQLTINAAGKTLLLDIDGAADASTQTVTLTDGAVIGSINLSDGDDAIIINGGTFTGTINGGAGTGDSLTLGTNFTTAGTITAVEDFDLAGNTLTVEHAITGVESVTQDGMDVNGGTIELNSSGSIAGTIYDTLGTGTLEFGADSNGGTFNIGGMIEDLDILITSGTVNTNGYAPGAGSAIDALSVSAGTRLNANDDITASGAITNTGTIFIDAGNTILFSDQVAAAGTFIFEVENNDSSYNTGFLNITNGANNVDFTGATVEVTISSSSGAIPDGTEFKIADGGTTITGGPGGTATEVTDNSFIYDFTIVDGTGIATPTNDTELYAVANRKSLSAISDNANNAIIAGVMFNDLLANEADEINVIQGALSSASSKKALNELLESLLPQNDGGIAAASRNFSDTAGRLTQTRLNNLDVGTTSGVTSGELTAGVRVWLQAFGSQAEQEMRDDIPGYESDTYGFAGGFDNDTIFENTTLGIGIAYANATVDSKDSNNTHAEINSVQLSLYGDYDINDTTTLTARSAYSWNDNQFKRYNVAGNQNLEARADYNSIQFDMDVKLEKDLFVGDYTTLTPSVSTGYKHYESEFYTEEGAGAVSLVVAPENMDVLDLGVGLDASWLYRKRNGSYIKPELKSKLTYDVIGDRIVNTSRFTAARDIAFTTKGPEPARTTLTVGPSLTYYSRNNWELSAEYEAQFKEDYASHAAYFKAAYTF